MSDPHANADATAAVLADINRHGADERWCLGDIVGYGPDPSDTVELIRGGCDLVLAGNHDLICAHPGQSVRWTGPLGRAISWAQDTLNAEQMSWLRSLRPIGERHGITAVHGSPRDPYWEFIGSRTTALACMRDLPALTLFGHTHIPIAFLRRDRTRNQVRARRRQTAKALHLRDVAQALLNPGAVGRPQHDSDPRASWLLLDTQEMTATWHLVPYDTSGVHERLIACGIGSDWAAR